MRITRLWLYRLAFLISLAGLAALVAEQGLPHSQKEQQWLDGFFLAVLFTGLVATLSRYLLNPVLIRRKVALFDGLSLLLSLLVLLAHLLPAWDALASSTWHRPGWLHLGVFLTFVREFSDRRLNFKRTLFGPAQLFIISFLIIILSGTLLLLLPGATYTGIRFTDALFTATSAVCITGLIVVDTGSHFTPFGQTIVLLLIQVGGLGILTFASYFSYFFKGGTTYENQLALGDMTNSRKLGEVFATLRYILVITFGIELVAATFIYFSLPAGLFTNEPERLFFAVFHAVSAFCNAGFTTLRNSLYEEGFRTNYPLQAIILVTFVLGSLGFPIVVNLLSYLRYRLQRLFTHRRQVVYRPWVLNLNSRINLITAAGITGVGLLLFLLLEQNHTLTGQSAGSRLITALFGVTTPRSAGFNNFSMAALSLPAVLLLVLLMWIGGAPQSTGGGIKTTTFAIATLNILSLAKGKTRIEVFRREIADISVRRSFAIITLSLMIISAGIVLVKLLDPGQALRDIVFECVSAYSTTGLSLGITSALSDASKIILSAMMFVGRVSMLTVVIAVFRKVRDKNYRYPQEELTIN
ncbi:MAG TPA: potassium transporter TrkG [Lacibacter sp.]|nr:potassium transporter TrkG [Lacibacter sp.]